MSGAHPITSGFKTLEFRSNISVRQTTSVSGRSQRIKTGGQFFTAKLESPEMTRGDFMADYSFLLQQDGAFDSFTIVLPEISSTRGTASGTLTNNATVAAGLSQCQTNGGSGTLKKGDLIKFSNHDKVYMLTADVTISGTNDTISFYPELTTVITNTTTITYDSVPMKVYMSDTTTSFKTNTNGSFSYRIDVIEEI